MGKLASPSRSDKCHDPLASHWVREDAGVHDRGVWSLVGTAGDDHSEAVIEWNQLLKRRKVAHVSLLGLRVTWWTSSCPPTHLLVA